MPVTVGQGLAGVMSGAQSQAGANAANAQGAQQMKLQQFLKGLMKPDGTYQPGVEEAAESARAEKKAELEQQSREQEMQMAQGAAEGLGSAHPGHKYQVKVGNVAVQEAEAPNQMLKSYLTGDNQAYSKAAGVYTAGQKQLQDAADGVAGIQSAVNRNDAGSIGAVRAGMLSSQGFKRFNTPEAYALAPSSMQSALDGFLQKNGLPTFGQDPQGAGVLNPAQIQNSKAFAADKLANIADRHQSLTDTATATYVNHPMAQDPTGARVMNLSAPFNARLQKMQQAMKQPVAPQAAIPSRGNVPLNPQAAPPAPGNGTTGTQTPAPSAATAPMTFEQWKAANGR